MADPSIFLNGGSALPSWRELRAGPLTLQLDPANLWVRYVRLGSTEVLRAIYAAVRDRNWGTVRPSVNKFVVDASADQFRAEWEAVCREQDIHFAWKGTLLGCSDGSLRFTFDGQALSTFWRARIGLCVLHPLRECAGRPCQIEHVDGSTEQDSFPDLVSPFQPFKQLRALTHEPIPGFRARVAFNGDIFETEDQRNWTDASFKTYSTPLELPFPVQVQTGERVRQEVTLTLANYQAAIQRGDPPQQPVKVSVPFEPALVLPALGLCIAAQSPELTPLEISRLAGLQLSFLRADLHFGTPLLGPGCAARWTEDLHRACVQADALGVGLHLALHLTKRADRDLDELLSKLKASKPRVLLWLVFCQGEKATAEETINLAKSYLLRFDPSIPIAAGTNAYFAELNRQRPPESCTVLPCYSLNPQVHAFDDATLVENLGGQADTVRTAWSFTQQPAVLSPITLRPRFNPNATASSDAQKEGNALPPGVDLRQMSLLGAAWTLGSLVQLAGTGHVHSLAYYETTGWKGVLETCGGSPRPGLFPSIPGSVYPVYHLFAELAGCERICPIHSPDPLAWMGATMLAPALRPRVLIANLLPRFQSIHLAMPATEVIVRMLTESNVLDAMSSPEAFRARNGTRQCVADEYVALQLPPFAIASIDMLPTC